MGHQIIKQPDGKLCVFSTETDAIVIADATADEIVRAFAKQAAKNSRRETRRAIDAVEAGDARKVYAQFAMTYEEAVEEHRRRGGDESMIYGGPEW